MAGTGQYPAEWEADGHRAIGRWMVEFSRLIGGMRTNMENRLRNDDEPALIGLVFAGAPAGQITDAFFGMCRLVGGLDDAENNIANRLEREVIDDMIGMRNRIAHGDWLIGQGLDERTALTHLIRSMQKRPTAES